MKGRREFLDPHGRADAVPREEGFIQQQECPSNDADIGHVLDYRRVRTIIIDECTAEHTDLLEALLGKLCVRLMKLAGVVGVRIKVTKLEIFPDCQVAISAECGQW